MSQELIKKIRSYVELNQGEEQFISTLFKTKSFAKGEHFLLGGFSLPVDWGTALCVMIVAAFLLRKKRA